MVYKENDDGSISFTPETFEEIHEQQQFRLFWKQNGCECNNQDDTKYIDDNTKGAIIPKHHWIHTTCGKIIQIG